MTSAWGQTGRTEGTGRETRPGGEGLISGILGFRDCTSRLLRCPERGRASESNGNLKDSGDLGGLTSGSLPEPMAVSTHD